MPLQIQCSACGHQGTVADSAVGKEIECPKCHRLLVPLTQEKMEIFAAKVLFAAPSRREESAVETVAAEPAGPEIPFTCPFCGESYPVSNDLAGKKVTCRNCREPCKVDDPSERKKVRVPKPKASQGLMWLGIGLALLCILFGFLLGQIFRS